MPKVIIPKTLEGFISVADAAKKYHITRHIINSWKRNGLIEYIKYPAEVLIRENEIPAFLRKMRKKGA